MRLPNSLCRFWSRLLLNVTKYRRTKQVKRLRSSSSRSRSIISFAVLALLPVGTYEMSIDSYIDDDDILLCPHETSSREPIVTQAELHQKMMDTWLTLKTFFFAFGLMATSTVLVVAIYFLVRAIKSNT